MDLAQYIHIHTEAAASRYVGAAGLLSLVYDHLLTIDDEIEYVWKARWTVPKFLFLLTRYSVPLVLVLHTLQLGGMHDLSADTLCVILLIYEIGVFHTVFLLYSCQVWFLIAVCLGIVSTGTGNFLVLARLWVVWGRNRCRILFTMGLFVFAQFGTLVCAIVVLVKTSPSMTFERDLRLCKIQRRSILGALYAPAVVFDGMALVAICWNALSQPRVKQRALLEYLRGDHFVFILLLFLMRLTNFATTLFGPLNIVFLGVCFIWSITTTTVSRLILDLRKNPVARPVVVDDVNDTSYLKL
ncbi:unnamed protein product [Cyclocybe aegerita]|uniref:DUF6533 domain-containing protein n=1 Tax=Cyclocybe aegerita TaxID=1973307 RepID=A0A8S0VSE5_CYCAE|nr:unnamed protein product [Cyclocybe aegerita]